MRHVPSLPIELILVHQGERQMTGMDEDVNPSDYPSVEFAYAFVQPSYQSVLAGSVRSG